MRRRIVLIFVAVMLLLSVTACDYASRGDSSHKQSGFAYVGEWKANAIKSRIDNEILYQVATITLLEDGTCVYKGESAKWEYVTDLGQIVFTLDSNKASGVLEIAEEDGKPILKYSTEIYYRSEDFVVKEKEYVDTADVTIGDTQAESNISSTDERTTTKATTITTTTETTTITANVSSTKTERSQPKEIAITLDNWDEYFEVYEWADWQENAFGEPTKFFGIRCSFNIKSEYADKCSATVACEYLLNQSHCDVTYDVQNQTYTVVDQKDYFDEHTATLTGGAFESYLSFSLGDGGKTTGSCTMAKYNFVKMIRVQGSLTFYE